MKTLIIILILSIATIATAAFIRSGDVWLKYDEYWMSQGDPTDTTVTGIGLNHVLYIDGSEHYLLIDGSDHYLRIDGVE